MDNTFNLLKALCTALGFEIEEIEQYLQKEGRPETKQFVGLDYKLTKVKRTRQSKEVTYSDGFKKLWELMPKRDGSSKKEANKEYNKKLKEGERHDVIEDGVTRYAAYVDATKTDCIFKLSNFIKDDHYCYKWAIPKEVTKLKLPKIDEELQDFAKKHGLTYPAPKNMYYPEYRRLLESEIEKRGL